MSRMNRNSELVSSGYVREAIHAAMQVLLRMNDFF